MHALYISETTMKRYYNPVTSEQSWINSNIGQLPPKTHCIIGWEMGG